LLNTRQRRMSYALVRSMLVVAQLGLFEIEG
jgi:hypothetical protein